MSDNSLENMYPVTINPARQTGKTTRMLRRALDAASIGKQVYIIAYNLSGKNCLRLKLNDLLDKYCLLKQEVIHNNKDFISFNNMGIIHFYTMGSHGLDIENNRMHGDRSALILYDHTILDCRYKHLLEQYIQDARVK